MSDWKDIRYLQQGSAPQRRAYAVLQRYSVMRRLHRFDPVLVGTFPLDIAVAGSDLDVICEVHNAAGFRQTAACFAHQPGYAVRQRVVGGCGSLF